MYTADVGCHAMCTRGRVICGEGRGGHIPCDGGGGGLVTVEGMRREGICPMIAIVARHNGL